ncbi:hypothetical protein ASPSYDRAFT_38096 [Aspergillus sydowii CBS 593.65]|uniref:Uncharacterized protein n=1 Tax=Aspergillus sydowii CBS 593.65 TaxID=1036612 RepID=A0A1L9TVU0_9EURO|nr:uncharacterized protein ASPSYDRAFT_38096 [Aspergillus sydowii CBS 593.65]OJJ63525.1 hypothetical protein ASPSYDRAFT_38096 [Aspergillus sydowii CBS 593.65]
MMAPLAGRHRLQQAKGQPPARPKPSMQHGAFYFVLFLLRSCHPLNIERIPHARDFCPYYWRPDKQPISPRITFLPEDCRWGGVLGRHCRTQRQVIVDANTASFVRDHHPIKSA